MSNTFWLPWVGLPHEIGADPRDGRGACCFKTAQAVREELGLSWPKERMDEWYQLASANSWEQLHRDWETLTTPCEARPGAITLLGDDPLGSFGLGVLASSEFALTSIHGLKLVSVPKRLWQNFQFYEVV
jgi:hypothetical protein